ncbi:uracil-DNA glycosylase family protein [Variovorax terrae]|uniref:Uracil-DNA glycosylase family protein n=1 Tax=Variovorax terrae TaxID=2923278 RepID=A0A9X1VXJ0_9BURK|nr:uracil-DNA glycosylase family protein [Variovorax terrae]MCJ0765100.1 uracil-DNA glycosylase family protein [Variovorax terrae]
MTRCDALLAEVRACTLCAPQLPLGPRPVLQLHPRARLLIAGQAPGRKVHASGIPFDDASGERLRDWLGLGREVFYDPRQVAILPMGFCYPGTGRSGDLPPRPECAPAWRAPLLAQLRHLQLTLLVGQYAQAWHLGGPKRPLTETVRDWRRGWDAGLLPLPHPSPRNNLWLRRNPWFEAELLPALRERVRAALAD